jgi:hypothetical protein
MPREIYTMRSKFRVEVLDSPAHCSGCRRAWKAGESAYVKRWMNLGNLVRTVLCNLEECWQEWDESIFHAGHPYDGVDREFGMSDWYDQDGRPIY